MNPAQSFLPGPTPNTLRAADGKIVTVPDGWVLIPLGDAAPSRRIKAAGDHFAVAEKRGRKVFSRGIWTLAATVERIRAELETERSSEGFAKKKEADAQRREKAQVEYVEDFLGAVVAFLAFHPAHADLANRMARAVTDHATPIGERHGSPDQTHPGRTEGRSRGHRLDAPPNDRIRFAGNPTGERQAAGSSPLARPAVEGIAGPVSKGRASRGKVSAKALAGSGDTVGN